MFSCNAIRRNEYTYAVIHEYSVLFIKTQSKNLVFSVLWEQTIKYST